MTTSITIENLWTTVRSDNYDLLKRARQIASYRQKNWEMARKRWIERLQFEGRPVTDPEYRRAVDWDGWRFIGQDSRFSPSDCTRIPTGCTNMLINTAYAMNEPLSFTDDRRRSPPMDVSWGLKPNKTSRDYQTEAVQALLNRGGRGIIQAPTASGKTFMMGLLIKELRTTTLIVVPRLVILGQIYDELLGMLTISEHDIGTISGNTFRPSLITVATIQSLANKLKVKSDWNTIAKLHAKYGWNLLIVDECHHCPSKTTWDVTMSLDTYYRVGFSATALDREDGEDIKTIGSLGEIVYNIPADPLVEQGWLIKPTIKFLASESVPIGTKDKWPDVYDTAIVFNRTRNLKILKTAAELVEEGRSVLIFVDRIDHGEEFVSLASVNSPFPVIFAHGQHPDRDKMLADFKKREAPILIATEGIIGEGWDFRGLDAIIVADGGKSFIQTVQKVGRGMRIEDGKTDVKVFDIADRGKYVTEHARERKLAWEKRGFDIDVSDCPYLG